MEDLKAEWESFQEEVTKLLKIAADHVGNVVKICHDDMNDNVLQVKRMIDSLEASMSKHLSHQLIHGKNCQAPT